MKLTDDELKQEMHLRWAACREADRLYNCGRVRALADANRLLDPLLTTAKDATASYKEVQTEAMRRIRLTRPPGDVL